MTLPSDGLALPVVGIRTPAKAILGGEHFVLYGAPALAAPVSTRGLVLRLGLRPGAELVLPRPLSALAAEIGATLGGRLRGWVRLQIASDIPVQAGLGSSAALAVALGRALTLAAGRCAVPLGADWAGALPDAGAEAVALRIAGLVEERIHGRASGIDTAAVAARGLVRLQRGADGSVRSGGICARGRHHFLLVDTGVRRATSDQIAKVGRERGRDSGRFDALAEVVGASVCALERGLCEGDSNLVHRAVGELGGVLASLGLEPGAAEPLRSALEALGLAVKVTGAGGGGFLLAHAVDEASVRAALDRLGADRILIPFSLGPTP